jgi:hypothetical protein
LLAKLDLTPPTALSAQRIAALPEPELDKALADAETQGDRFFASVTWLLDRARPED